jgi:DNA-binding MarR family transcriptional regulator
MSGPQTPPPPFGQAVGEAQRALSALLYDLLEGQGTTFDRWVTLNTLATRGPAIPRGQLRRDLAEGLAVDAASVSELLDQLESSGLIQVSSEPAEHDSARIELTADGEALHRSLRESIGRLTVQVVGGLDPEDLRTAVGVLREATARAQALRAGEPVST